MQTPYDCKEQIRALGVHLLRIVSHGKRSVTRIRSKASLLLNSGGTTHEKLSQARGALFICRQDGCQGGSRGMRMWMFCKSIGYLVTLSCHELLRAIAWSKEMQIARWMRQYLAKKRSIGISG